MIKNITVLFLFLLLELFTSCSFFWEIPPKLSYTYVKDTANTYENIVIKAAAKDNNNGLLSYQINFGDNHISHWSSYLPQNETLKVYHQYINSGEYKIKLRVKNRDGILSYWSDPLFIKISDNPVKPPLGKLWGGLNKDSGIKIIKTNDGGYFVAGNTESFGENASDIVLIRLDNQGNIQWTKILGEYNNNKCSDIIETSDGGFILVAYRHGTSFLSTDETYIIKLNSIGYMEWESDYEYVNTKGSRISSVAEISDGYILAGIYETPINLSEYCSVGGYMFKISKDGEFLWQTEGPYDPFVESQLYSVLNLGRDTILYTGNNGDNLYYAEFLNDSSHSAVYTKEFGDQIGGTGAYGRDITRSNDGNIIILGNIQYSTLLLKIDINGNIIWYKTYDGEASLSGSSVKKTNDGGYIIAGTKGGMNSDMDIFLLKVNSTGEEEWEKTYGGDRDDIANSVELFGNTGYIITGLTNSTETGTEKLFILKTDLSGNIIN